MPEKAPKGQPIIAQANGQGPGNHSFLEWQALKGGTNLGGDLRTVARVRGVNLLRPFGACELWRREL